MHIFRSKMVETIPVPSLQRAKVQLQILFLSESVAYRNNIICLGNLILECNNAKFMATDLCTNTNCFLKLNQALLCTKTSLAI